MNPPCQNATTCGVKRPSADDDRVLDHNMTSPARSPHGPKRQNVMGTNAVPTLVHDSPTNTAQHNDVLHGRRCGLAHHHPGTELINDNNENDYRYHETALIQNMELLKQPHFESVSDDDGIGSDSVINLSLRSNGRYKMVSVASTSTMEYESDIAHPVDAVETTIRAEANDVLCGRGGLTNRHPGNALFRKLVQDNKALYRTGNALVKRSLPISIVRALKEQKSRFLRQKDKSTGVWTEMGTKGAINKTSQALREQAKDELLHQVNSLVVEVMPCQPMFTESTSDDAYEPIPLNSFSSNDNWRYMIEFYHFWNDSCSDLDSNNHSGTAIVANSLICSAGDETDGNYQQCVDHMDTNPLDEVPLSSPDEWNMLDDIALPIIDDVDTNDLFLERLWS